MSFRLQSRRAQSIQFLPIHLCSFRLQFQFWLLEHVYLKALPPLLSSGDEELLATVTPMPLSADLLCSWRVGWQKVIGAWTCVSLYTRKKNLSPCLRLVRLCLIVWKCSRENHLSTFESQVVKWLSHILGVGGGRWHQEEAIFFWIFNNIFKLIHFF